MDIYCPTCGEPWEMDSLHDQVEYRYPAMPWVMNEKPPRQPGHNDPFEVKVGSRIFEKIERTGWYDPYQYSLYFEEISKEFRRIGCKAMLGYGNKDYCKPKNNSRALLASAAYEVMGGDLDGAEAMISDYQYLFGFEDE